MHKSGGNAEGAPESPLEKRPIPSLDTPNIIHIKKGKKRQFGVFIRTAEVRARVNLFAKLSLKYH